MARPTTTRRPQRHHRNRPPPPHRRPTRRTNQQPPQPATLTTTNPLTSIGASRLLACLRSPIDTRMSDPADQRPGDQRISPRETVLGEIFLVSGIGSQRRNVQVKTFPREGAPCVIRRHSGQCSAASVQRPRLARRWMTSANSLSCWATRPKKRRASTMSPDRSRRSANTYHCRR